MEQVIYPIDGKYNPNTEIDVSIIVPLYNSKWAVQDQILRWVSDDDIRTEVIYVDDQCPQHSKNTVISSWRKRKDRHKYLVKLICSLKNRGYGGANNLGAYFAKGKYLIFLNSDTVVTPNWVGPITELLQDPTVGIVGNLQLKEGGKWHGTIDSAGSLWSWENMNFVHLGRHIYCEGQPLKRPIHISKCPKRLLQIEEREMVTGCCFGMRKEVFDEIGGFNLNYRIGYWEDSEICLTTRARGYKILYQPNSIIYHKLHHADSGGHMFHDFNKQYFFNKWIDSEDIDQYVTAKRLIKPTRVSNILVNRSAANGDVLVATSILPGIKEKYPEAKIWFCTDCPGVLKGNPYIDHVVEYTDNTMFQQKYDLDYAYERAPNMNIIEAYGMESNIKPTEPFIDCEPIEGLPKKYVVIHAGRTAWVGRNWDRTLFQMLAIKLEQEGYDVIWVGGQGDGFTEVHLIGQEEQLKQHDFRDKTNFQQLATIMKGAKLFVGIDSFPFHVAQAMNTPGVCFFGSILPETRIYRENMNAITAEDLKCLGCHHRKLAPATVTNECETGTLDCEKLVTLQMFWNKIEEKLCNQKVLTA